MPERLAGLLPYLVVVGAGVSLALQQVVNARLRFELGSPWLAGVASYAVGAATMLLLLVATGAPRPTFAVLLRPSWVSWTGGMLGAVFVGTAIVMVPRLGAATVLALVVLGQMIASVTVDQFGLFGVARHSAGLPRLAGAALLVVGVGLMRR